MNDEPSEIWKPIPDFPGYEASSRGRIRSCDRVGRDGRRMGGKVLTPRQSNRGYWQVNVREGGKPRTITVHRAVLLAHAGPPPPGRPFTRHFPNDDPADNRWPENLSWCSQEVNEQDKIRRQKRLGYVAAVHAPSQTRRSDAKSPEPARRGGHPRLSRIVTKIRRWWG